MNVMDALRVTVQQVGREFKLVALHHFLVVGDVALKRERRAIGRVLVGKAYAERFVEGIGRLVEGCDVIGDVHVAVVVDPLGPDARGELAIWSWEGHGHGLYACRFPPPSTPIRLRLLTAVCQVIRPSARDLYPCGHQRYYLHTLAEPDSGESAEASTALSLGCARPDVPNAKRQP